MPRRSKEGDGYIPMINETLVNPIVPFTNKMSAQDFYTQWIKSPEYKKRLKNTGYGPKSTINANQAIDYRLKALGKLQPIEYLSSSPSFADPITGKVNINPNDIKGTKRDTIISHELGHIAGATPGQMSFDEQELIRSSRIQGRPNVSGIQGSDEYERALMDLGDWSHLNKPEEIKADLYSLRHQLFNEGIYNILEGKEFTEKDLLKAEKLFKGDRAFERLKKKLGKDNLIKLMNTIASNKDSSQNNFA
jgi:hypothetical protein